LRYNRPYDVSELTFEHVRDIFNKYFKELHNMESNKVIGFNCYDIPYEIYPWTDAYEPPYKILSKILANSDVCKIDKWQKIHTKTDSSEKYTLTGGSAEISENFTKNIIALLIVLICAAIIIGSIVYITKNISSAGSIDNYVTEYD
jgi:hypothetical protein